MYNNYGEQEPRGLQPLAVEYPADDPAARHRYFGQKKTKKLPKILQNLTLTSNVRLHSDLSTQKKIDFEWEILLHSPYSPDLAPTDYHLFCAKRNTNGYTRKTVF